MNSASHVGGWSAVSIQIFTTRARAANMNGLLLAADGGTPDSLLVKNANL